MNSLTCIQKYFKIDAIFDRQPMLQDRGDVVNRWGPCDNSRVLDTLKLMYGLLGETKKK